MGHPNIKLGLTCTFEPLFLTDEDFNPILTTLVKMTFRLGVDGSLTLSEEQAPFEAAGRLAVEAEVASYAYEPETAFVKPATDVVLVGHAHAGAAAAQSIDVGVKVGPVQKVVRVFGDRYWVKTGGQIFSTKPQPFLKMPLIYERAFGGWDKASKDDGKWRCDPRNPVGRGFGDPLRYVEEGKVPMPNLEDPQHLIRRYGDAPPPAGFGFVSPNWEPRAKFAGTYDKAWDEERKPLLPKDFDRRFFNAASPGLIAPGYLKGDESVIVVNAASVTPLKFDLPGVSRPVCRVVLRGNRVEVLSTNLDTVIIDTDDMRVFLLWRAHMAIASGAHDVLEIEVTSDKALRQADVA